MTTRVKRRDGSIFDAPDDYLFQDGDTAVRSFSLMDGAGTLPTTFTDTELRDFVAAAVRPKDVSRLSAAQLRRAYVAFVIGEEDILSKSDSYVEGAFRSLTTGGTTQHKADPKVATHTPDGVVRDAADGMRDMQDALRDHAYDAMSADLQDAWKTGKGDVR